MVSEKLLTNRSQDLNYANAVINVLRRGNGLIRWPVKYSGRSVLASILPLLIIGTFTLFFPKTCVAQGENALDFLNSPVGAISAALGQSSYACINDPEAIFGNPSLLGNTAFFASHQELLLDMRSEAIAVAIGVGRNFSLGLGAIIFSPGEIVGYSQDNIKTGTLEAGERVMKLAASRSGKISLGASASIYGERLDDQIGTGVGFGGGISAETEMGRFSVSADNVGPDFKIGSSSAPLPRRLSISGWIPLRRIPVDLIFDLSQKYGIGTTAAAGLEYCPFSSLLLRTGAGTAAPWGLGFRLTRGSIAIDYSYIPPADFGDKHLLSFVLSK